MPDVPGVIEQSFGFYDLVSGAWFASNLVNEKSAHYKLMPRYSDATFTPESLAGSGLR